MKKISEPITFFGSGPVAAQSLRLLARQFTIEAVITKPRPPHHKGDVPVLAVAAELNLPVHTASNSRELNELFSTHPVKSRLAVLIDFGIIVSQQVIDYFPLGIVNSHFSILPELRGADPITFAILSGQKQTGVSLMLLVQAMDEGPLLATTSYDIPPGTTSPELTEALIDRSYHSLSAIVPLYINGTAKPLAQDASIKATYSNKLSKTDGLIDWNKPAARLEREVRAFIEWPKSRTALVPRPAYFNGSDQQSAAPDSPATPHMYRLGTSRELSEPPGTTERSSSSRQNRRDGALGGVEIIITKTKVLDIQGQPGQIVEKHNRLVIACGQDALEIITLKPAGKKDMPAKAFLAGYSRLL